MVKKGYRRYVCIPFEFLKLDEVEKKPGLDSAFKCIEGPGHDKKSNPHGREANSMVSVLKHSQ